MNGADDGSATASQEFQEADTLETCWTVKT